VIPLLLVALPAIVGAISYFIEDARKDLALLLGASVAHFVVTILLWTSVLPPGATSLGALLAIDVPGLVFLSITSLLFLVASLYTIPYVLYGTHDPQAAPHRFVPCLLWFLSAMTLVSVTAHLAILWAAVEATTLASAPLIYFYRRKEALEAAWKYLLICSVGIALALLGTFFLGTAAAGANSPELTMPALLAAAPHMTRPWLEAAFVLALVGYGTKMGLAPLHTWLPDAHSQAPSPVSAILSGSLLNCAFLGILRFYQVCVAAGDAQFARTLLIVLGIASIGIGAVFMIRQRDYKRLFAYSSVENMGIVAVGVGLGGAATYGGMLHAVNHSLGKAALFFLAGNVLRRYGTTDASRVRGVLRTLPWTGTLLAMALLAIGGAPPFGPFLTELMIFRTALSTNAALGALFIALLAAAFLGMAGTIFPMLQGSAADTPTGTRDRPLSVATPLFACVLVLMLGLHVPDFLATALRAAAQALGGEG